MYAGNNPIIFIDYYGFGPWDIVKGVGLIAGGVVQIAGGVALAATPSPGLTQVAGGALITNGVMNIGWGGTVIANNGEKDMAEGTLQAVGQKVDEGKGDGSTTFEQIGVVGDFFWVFQVVQLVIPFRILEKLQMSLMLFRLLKLWSS